MVFEPRATTSIASAALALPCTPSLREGTLSTLRAFPGPPAKCSKPGRRNADVATDAAVPAARGSVWDTGFRPRGARGAIFRQRTWHGWRWVRRRGWRRTHKRFSAETLQSGSNMQAHADVPGPARRLLNQTGRWGAMWEQCWYKDVVPARWGGTAVWVWRGRRADTSRDART